MRRRWPMMDFLFIFQNERTKQIYEWETTANVEGQALEEAREHLTRTVGPVRLLEVKRAVAKTRRNVLR